MHMQYIIDEFDEYIYLKFIGDSDYDVLKSAFKKLYTKCVDNKYSNIVIDFYELNMDNINVTKRIVFFTYLHDMFKYYNAKFACLIDKEKFENTVNNFDIGPLFDYKVFDKIDDAISWFKIDPYKDLVDRDGMIWIKNVKSIIENW